MSTSTTAIGGLIRVVSSNIAAVGYDGWSSTLTVAFNSGSIYEYYGVPPSIYTGLMRASSKGSFHYHNIRRRYRYRRVA